MTGSDLTTNIENKLLSLVQVAEQKARAKDLKVDAKLYLQLADLYHFHKNYSAEVDILTRFTRLKNTVSSDEVVKVYERINSVKGLLAYNRKSSENSKLELIPNESDSEEISISSEKEVKRRVHKTKQPFSERTLKILCLSAACTGISDNDEVVQLALVLIEYSAQRKKKAKILETYRGDRKTRIKVSQKIKDQFGLNYSDNEMVKFAPADVQSIFQQADFIVSHNDAEVERKLMATLLPSVAKIPWYSSERDIPWRAMGFNTNRLTILAKELNEKAPRACFERAMTIARILQKKEPFSEHIYLERLYNMQPMGELEWTPQLKKQVRRMKGPLLTKSHWVGIGIFLFLALLVVSSFFLTGVFQMPL